MYVWMLAAALALPLGYWIVSSSMQTYSFLAFYRPEQVFENTDDTVVPAENKGTEILQALNAEIAKENHVKKGDENWLLVRLDNLWQSVRKYVSPAGKAEPPVLAESGSRSANRSMASQPQTAGVPHSELPGADGKERPLPDLLSLSRDPEVLGNAADKVARALLSPSGAPTPLLPASSKAAEAVRSEAGKEASDRPYRFEALKGLRTQSLIYQFNRNLTLEGTVEAEPMGETDPDLSDFGIRSVYALNFLRDRPAPAATMGYNAVHSGYPLSYGIGLNYRLSPGFNLRFDYSHETLHEDLVQYNGTWESSLMADSYRGRPEELPSLHNFFVGLRYLCHQRATRIPLHTGFFYSTNMEDEPLASNVSVGFSIGGGINRRDLNLGFAWRFRVWDNPEQRFVDSQDLQQLETRVSNQFLFTLLF